MVMASLKIETIHTWVFAFDSAQTCNIVNNLVLSYRGKKKKKNLDVTMQRQLRER